jgi:hypothetical protein
MFYLEKFGSKLYKIRYKKPQNLTSNRRKKGKNKACCDEKQQWLILCLSNNCTDTKQK